jgi:hypothetical protein
MKVFFILGICLFLISGCEVGGDFTYKIENNSDYEFEIKFKIYDMGTNLTDKSIDIKPHQNSSFFTLHTVNDGCNDLGSHFQADFDTLVLSLKNDTMILTKDFFKRDNWEYSPNCKKYGAHNDYLFIIENKDIERKIK